MRKICMRWMFLISLFVFLSLSASVLAEEARHHVSAWGALIQSAQGVPSHLTSGEREALMLMTPAQAASYARGTDASEIQLKNGESLAFFLARKTPAEFDLSWYSIDGGAATLSGGEFRLQGSVGQADAGSMSGGDFRLTGGFFATPKPKPTGPCSILCDDFETGGLDAWSLVR